MKVIRTMDYKGAKIYVIRYGIVTFQYLFGYRKKGRKEVIETYESRHIAWPQWWRWITWPFNQTLFDNDTLDSIERSFLSGAMETIDKLKE